MEILVALGYGAGGGLLANVIVLNRVPGLQATELLRRPAFYGVVALQTALAGAVAALVTTGASVSAFGSLMVGFATAAVLEFLIGRTVTTAAADSAGSNKAVAGRTWLHRAITVPLALLGIVAMILVGWVLTASLSQDAALVYGVVAVVLVGAVGLALRGVGEHVSKTKSNAHMFKAYGYYFGMLAYVGTASVAFYSGLSRL